MLKFIRRNAQATWVKLVFAAIVVVFIFWGMGGMVAGEKALKVAQVNDDVIDPVEFQRSYNNLLRLYQNVYKDNFKPEIAKMLDLKGKAVDQLIRVTLMRQEATRLGLGVGETELRDSIAAMTVFQQDGRFNKELYVRALRANSLTPSDFEAAQREDLLVNKLQDLILAGVHVSEAEVRDRYRFDNEQVALRFIKLDGGALAPEVNFTDEDVQAYFDQHKETFREPERVRLEYVLYPSDKFGEKAEVPDTEAQQYYDSHQAEFTTDGQAQPLDEVRAQIAARLKQDKGREQARLLANADHGKVAAGETLASVAKAAGLSVTAPDPVAQTEPLPGIGRSPLVNAAFAADAGQLGPVVDAPTGAFVFRVLEKIPARLPDLPEIRGRAEEALRQERAEALAKSKAETLLAELKQKKDIDAVAASANLKVEDTGPFGRQGTYVPSVGATADLKKDTFQLTPENPVAPAVYAVPGSSVIAVLKERIPADETKFESDKENLIRQADERRKGQAIEEFVNYLKSRATIELDENYIASVPDTGRPFDGGPRRSAR